MVVAEVIKGSQAHSEGLVKPGDRVEEVDGRGIFGLTPSEVEEMIRQACVRVLLPPPPPTRRRVSLFLSCPRFLAEM